MSRIILFFTFYLFVLSLADGFKILILHYLYPIQLDFKNTKSTVQCSAVMTTTM